MPKKLHWTAQHFRLVHPFSPDRTEARMRLARKLKRFSQMKSSQSYDKTLADYGHYRHSVIIGLRRLKHDFGNGLLTSFGWWTYCSQGNSFYGNVDKYLAFFKDFNSKFEDFIVRLNNAADHERLMAVVAELRKEVLSFQTTARNFKEQLVSEDGILSSSSVGENHHHFVEIADRAKALLSEFLHVLNNESMETRLHIVDLSYALGEIRASCGITAFCDIEAPSGINVSLDLLLFGRILLNLVNNAREAGATTIVVTGNLNTEGSASIRVIDNGPGIPRRVFKRILEPGVSTKQSGGSNMGEGLAICKDIAERHGGTISYWNNSHKQKGAKGATFEIVLPVAPPEAMKS